jgi:hypothetical protein
MTDGDTTTIKTNKILLMYGQEASNYGVVIHLIIQWISYNRNIMWESNILGQICLSDELLH